MWCFRQGFTSLHSPISTNTDNNLKQGVDSNLVCLFRYLLAMDYLTVKTPKLSVVI
jgi:hypothetical protein